MRFSINFVRKYPLSLLLTVAIWVLCLIPVPETPLSDVTMIDKWTHIAFYLVLSLTIGVEDWRARRVGRLVRLSPQAGVWHHRLLIIFILPACMGGLIELVQAYCTNGMRSGEWMDFLADAIGSALGFICILLAACHAKG